MEEGQTHGNSALHGSFFLFSYFASIWFCFRNVVRSDKLSFSLTKNLYLSRPPSRGSSSSGWLTALPKIVSNLRFKALSFWLDKEFNANKPSSEAHKTGAKCFLRFMIICFCSFPKWIKRIGQTNLFHERHSRPDERPSKPDERKFEFPKKRQIWRNPILEIEKKPEDWERIKRISAALIFCWDPDRY